MGTGALLGLYLVSALAFASTIGIFMLISKIKSESSNVPMLVRIFGLEVFFPDYLTPRGREYRRWYWRLALVVVSSVTLIALVALLSHAGTSQAGHG